MKEEACILVMYRLERARESLEEANILFNKYPFSQRDESSVRAMVAS